MNAHADRTARRAAAQAVYAGRVQSVALAQTFAARPQLVTLLRLTIRLVPQSPPPPLRAPFPLVA